jgi:hypothetical protein
MYLQLHSTLLPASMNWSLPTGAYGVPSHVIPLIAHNPYVCRSTLMHSKTGRCW